MSLWIGPIQRYVMAGVPWFLQQKNVSRFLESMGLVLDGALLSLQVGLALSYPLICDPSALPVLSYDRSITLYPTEPIASQRFRLSQWYQLHRQRGTHQGEARNLQPFFLSGALPRIRVVFQCGDASCATWGTLDPDGTWTEHQQTPSNWNWDGVTWKDLATVTGATNANPIVITTAAPHGLTMGQPVKISGVLGNTAANVTGEKVTVLTDTTFSIPVAGSGGYTSGGTVAGNTWSRFWVIVYTDGLPIPPLPAWDGGQTWGGGSVWDGLFTAEQITDMVAAVTGWKAAHSTLWGLIFATDPDSFDPTASIAVSPDGTSNLPDGKWYTSVDPVTGKPTRLASAVIAYNLGQA